MIYTTQGLMTPADMADMADLYDWNAGAQEAAAEEAAMEETHADHADNCDACKQEDTHREALARYAVAVNEARQALANGVEAALTSPLLGLPSPTRRVLERALAVAAAQMAKAQP